MPAVTVARAPRQGLRAAGPSHTVSVPRRLKCPTQPAVASEAGFKPGCCARATVKRAMAGLLAASACLVLDVQGLHAAEVTQLFNSSCAGALLLKRLRAAQRRSLQNDSAWVRDCVVRGAPQAATLGAATWCRPARRCSSATWTRTAQPHQRPSTVLFIAGRARCRAMESGETLTTACYALSCLTARAKSQTKARCSVARAGALRGCAHGQAGTPRSLPGAASGLCRRARRAQGKCTFAARLTDEEVQALTQYVMSQAAAGWK